MRSTQIHAEDGSFENDLHADAIVLNTRCASKRRVDGSGVAEARKTCYYDRGIDLGERAYKNPPAYIPRFGCHFSDTVTVQFGSPSVSRALDVRYHSLVQPFSLAPEPFLMCRPCSYPCTGLVN